MIKINDGSKWIENSFVLQKDCNCEHCGQLEPYTLVYREDTDWCIDCYNVNKRLNSGEFWNLTVSDEDIKDLKETERKCKVTYFLKRAKELEPTVPTFSYFGDTLAMGCGEWSVK